MEKIKRKGALSEFARYVSLNVAGMIGLSCYILADTFFVAAGLGTNGLTALNLAIPVYSFIHGSGLMIGMGGGTKYSILRSRGNGSGANRAFINSLYIAAALAAVFVLLGVFCSGGISSLLGADEEVFAMANTYLKVILLFAPAFLLNNVLLCFVRNDGGPQLSMAAMITGSLSNVVLDWVFIFPCGMGIFGAAFATGLAPIISMAVLLRHFIQKKNSFRIVRCIPSLRLCGGMISSGIPSLITEVSSGVVIIVFNAIIIRLQGNVGVAAYGVIANLSLVVIAVYTGMAQGIQPIMSRDHGAGDRGRIYQILRYAVISAVVFSAAVYAVIFIGASGIVGIFNSEGNELMQSIGTDGMRLYFIGCPFAGFNIIASVYFTSTEKQLPAHIISVLRGFAVIIPMAFLLSAAAGLNGVWCAFPATEITVSSFAAVFLMKTVDQNLRA